MRTFPAKYLLLFVSALLIVTNSFGQNPVSYLNDAGSPAYATNIPVPNGYINLANGNLHLEIPLASPPQRGAVKVNERLVYDSRIWMFSPFGTHGSFHWWPYNIYGTSTTSGGWRVVTGGETGSLSTNIPNWYSYGCQQPYYGAPWEYDGDTWYTQYYSWTDPSGMTHPFSATEVWEETDCWDPAPPTYTSGSATDGSPYYLSFDSYGNAIITGLHGVQVYPSVSDRYGNGIGYGSGGNLVDDTGRTPVIATTSGSATTYSVLAPNGTPATGGTRVNYVATTAPVSVSTSFGWSSGGHVIYEWIDPSDLQPIHTLQLPDGSQYTFNYDSYGEMTSMTLPTGGTVTFGYSNVVDSTGTPNRWVASYQVGSNPATTFSAGTCGGGGCSQYVNMTRPSGDLTEYLFTVNNGAWNTTTGVYSGGPPLGPSALVLTTSNVNTYSNPCTTYPCTGPNYLLNNLSTTLLTVGGSALASQTYTTYAGLLGPSMVQQWDFAAGAAPATPPSTTPSSETDYTYTSSGDLSTVTVKDSTGATASQTTYGYTTSAAAPSPTPPNYYPSGAPVSYLHTIQNWLNTNPSASPTTTITMDASGQVTSIQDPDSHTAATTTYQCSHSLPSLVTNPLGQQTQFGYDCGSGAITSMQDPNDLAVPRSGTTYAYESLAGRLHQISYPDTGSTTYTYPHPYEVDTAIGASPDPTITSQSIVDGFGRAYQTIQNGVTATTSYDTNGRVSCVDNPYPVGGSTSGQTCITSYDTLNRPLTKTLPDGSTQQLAYTVDTTDLKAVTTTTDEAGTQMQNYSNALGQLTNVVEPGPLTTNYTYDGLGNLTQVNQLGNGASDIPRVRTFAYDSLSRPIQAFNPESGYTCYGTTPGSVPPNGSNCTPSYDANGNLQYSTDARGVVIHNTYDALNRLTEKREPTSGTCDQYGYDGSTNGIGRLMWDSNCYNANELFTYDPMGRITLQYNYTPGHPNDTDIMMTATYDKAGNMTSFHYPDGRHITQTFDASGRLNYINYADQSGTTVNYPYVSGITYSPLGGMSTIALGNGVNESISYNNRSQPCEIAASYPATPGSSTMAFASDKQYYFSSAGTGGVCGTTTSNNGNVWHIDDALNSAAKKQNFTFDSLNRLTGGSRADNGFNYTYSIDSFGNMQQTNTLTTNPAISFPGTSNQFQVAVSGYTYDAAGNLIDTGSSGGGHHYTYDVFGQQSQVDYGTTAWYTYDGLGARIRKDTATYGATEYIHFGSQLVAETNPGVSWTDYIYANGQKIARADSYDARIHMSATNCSGCGSTNTFAVTYSLTAANGLPIQAGDKLVWRQYQDGVASGGVDLWLNNSFMATANDTNSQPIYADTTMNAWHSRSVDLSSYASDTITTLGVWNYTGGSPGSWNLYFADMALLRADGTVIPIYNGTMQSLVTRQGAAISGFSAATEQGTSIMTAANQTTYFAADHLGSARLQFSGGGWPTWSQDYAPYGQEVTAAQPTQNNYKFTGYERDPETAIAAGTEEDYAQARYYSSAIQGRFMSPDPYAGSMNLANPQSFNRYTYALNNPLKFVDPSGLNEGDIWQDEEGNRYYENADGSLSEVFQSDEVTPYGDCGIGCVSYRGSDLTYTIATLPIPEPGSPWGGSSLGPGPHYSRQDVCAASALFNKGVPTALDALGMIPGENTIVKGVQLGGALISAGIAIFSKSNFEDGALSGIGLGLTAAEPYATNIAIDGVDMVPIVGNLVSGYATYRDIKGPEGMGKSYDDCMAGKD